MKKQRAIAIIIFAFFAMLQSSLLASNDTITLDKVAYPVNSFIQYKVTTAKPYRFQLDGGCGNGVLAYKIYKVELAGDVVAYDHASAQMDCGMPQTAPDTVFHSTIVQGIKQPGKYYIAIPFKNGELRSSVFEITPFKGGIFYGILEAHDPSLQFPNESYFTQITTGVELNANGTYKYNYGSLLSGEGTYTVAGDSITFKQLTSVNADVKNPEFLLRGSYRYWFSNNGTISLSKSIDRIHYYIYSLTAVKK
jgi:hypothetical protein